MAGHSKWAQIKRKKAVTDGKRSQLFSRLSKNISVEARLSNGDKNAPGLRAAIEKAREANMPNENIERAISKANETKSLEKIVYEAYGPGGVGLIIEALTDNKNRSAQEIKFVLSKNGTSLAGIGSVLWAFKKENDSYTPETTVVVDDSFSDSLEKLIEDLEELEDVSEVITNAE